MYYHFDDGDSFDEYKLKTRFKFKDHNQDLSASRSDNTDWNATTSELKSNDKAVSNRIVSNNKERECKDIYSFFKTHTLDSKALCAIASSEIEAILRSEGFTQSSLDDQMPRKFI